MPGQEINLIPEETYLDKERESKREKNTVRLTIGIVIVAALFIISAYLYSLYLNSKSASIREKIDTETKKIDRLRTREILLRWTKAKLSGIGQILADKPRYDKQLEALDFVTNLLTAESRMMGYSFEGNTANFDIVSSNSDNVEKFINNLLEENKNESKFNTIKIGGVELGKEGSYRLSFSVVLNN